MSKEPRTTQDWLAMPKDKLGRALGEALTPEPWKHELHVGGRSHKHYHCSRCGEDILQSDIQVETEPYHWAPGHSALRIFGGDCSVPDLIDIKDWNVAMAWRDKIFGTDQQSCEMLGAIMDIETESRAWDIADVLRWWTRHAQPKHYLIAAALAKEGATE